MSSDRSPLCLAGRSSMSSHCASPRRLRPSPRWGLGAEGPAVLGPEHPAPAVEGVPAREVAGCDLFNGICLQGFTLNEADVDRVIQAARELEGGQVLVDPNAPPQQSVDTLLRVVRILQAALDVQFSENEELTADFNELQARQGGCAAGWLESGPESEQGCIGTGTMGTAGIVTGPGRSVWPWHGTRGGNWATGE